MTGTTPVSVAAQWAVHGKRLDRRGYRLIACSTGDLSARHFEEAIGRFSPGTPDVLPQATVSFAHTRSGPGGKQGTDYLALALHDYADQMAGDDDQLKYDDDGRRIVVTRYFCLPYPELAKAVVTYQAMFRALSRAPLPTDDGPPIEVEMTADASVRPAVDDLAVQAAALLLTTRPVCLLGADDTTMADRLAFIDTVMSLLPYGFRPRMTAATWTRPTNRDHRFRLFFSDAARTVDQPDSILYWGRPGETVIDPGDDWVFEYLTWLRDKVSQPTAKLARRTDLTGFKSDQVLRMLDVIGVVSADPDLSYAESGQDLLHPQFTPQPRLPRELDYGEMLLRNCAKHVGEGDTPEAKAKVRSDIVLLGNLGRDPTNRDRRALYQQVIKETGLLERNGSLGGNATLLYPRVLRVAFKVPLDYEAYCQVEDCLADPDRTPPQAELLKAIADCGVADDRVEAILHWLRQGGDKQALDRWYFSGEVDLTSLIRLLSTPWKRPQHALWACNVLRYYLSTARIQKETAAEVRRALHGHGFLAAALQDNKVGDEQYQVSTLRQFLAYAYQPAEFKQSAILKVLTGSHYSPTAPLLAAVLLYAEGEYAKLAVDAYTHGLMTRTVATDPQISRHLVNLLPVFPEPPAGTRS